MEIGEKYTEIFWQNVKYTAIAFSINFIVLFLLIYFTNLKIKKGLKAFFDDDNQNSGESKTLKNALEIFKKEYVTKILEENGWNQTKTAKVLGIQRTYVIKLINELNIQKR